MSDPCTHPRFTANILALGKNAHCDVCGQMFEYPSNEHTILQLKVERKKLYDVVDAVPGFLRAVSDFLNLAIDTELFDSDNELLCDRVNFTATTIKEAMARLGYEEH